MKITVSILFVAITACSFSKKTISQKEKIDATISMEKTPCYGRCPNYAITIYGDGKAEFLGKRFVDSIGTFEKYFSIEDVKSLVKAFEEANFFGLQDEYTARVSDMSTVYVSFTQNGKTKKIKDYYNAPELLKQLEKMIEKMAFSTGWKRIEPQK